MIQMIAALSFLVSYAVRVLLFEERDSHHGPYPSKLEKVVRIERLGEQLRTYEQPVTLFDRLRYWTSRAYEIDKTTGQWYVREDRMEMWSCPKCLTFWVAAAVTIPYCLFTGQWKQIPIVWGAVCGAAYLIYEQSDPVPDFPFAVSAQEGEDLYGANEE